VSKGDAREQVLRALYAAEQRGAAEPDASGLDGRARQMLQGVWEHRDELDRSLEEAATNWRVERMPVVDRNILRVALYELRYDHETPTSVVIAEAVKRAKEYSTEKSGTFVNGVLSTLAGSERSSAADDGPVTLPPTVL
jgi:N utilization substance protein B